MLKSEGFIWEVVDPLSGRLRSFFDETNKKNAISEIKSHVHNTYVHNRGIGTQLGVNKTRVLVYRNI